MEECFFYYFINVGAEACILIYKLKIFFWQQ